METIEVLQFLQEQIHTVIVATNDEHGNPVTCAVDIMDCSEDGLYFLTAKGKNFYRRLKANGCLSLTGIKGENTLTCIAVSVRGKIKEIGPAPLQRLLDKNPYMYEIYPTEQSRIALAVFNYMKAAANGLIFLKNLSKGFRFLSAVKQMLPMDIL